MGLDGVVLLLEEVEVAQLHSGQLGAEEVQEGEELLMLRVPNQGYCEVLDLLGEVGSLLGVVVLDDLRDSSLELFGVEVEDSLGVLVPGLVLLLQDGEDLGDGAVHVLEDHLPLGVSASVHQVLVQVLETLDYLGDEHLLGLFGGASALGVLQGDG